MAGTDAPAAPFSENAVNIRQAMESLSATMADRNGLAASYHDGQGYIAVTVTRGQSLLRLSEPQGGAKTILWENDFFVPVASLVRDGQKIEPQNGHMIDVTEEDGLVHRYAVLSPGLNEPAARKVDSRVAWRVHTKFVKVV